MTKIYLHKNLSIVLALITALLSFVYIYYTYTLYGISLVNLEALQDPGFKYKFVETVVYALAFLSASVYFISKVILKNPIIEVRYEDDFIYEEITEEVSEDEDSNDESNDEISDEDKK
jgi:uncharacterized membrane protein